MRRQGEVSCASCEYVRVASEMGTEGGAYQVARCMHPSGCGAWLEKAIRSELMMWMSAKESREEQTGKVGRRGDWLMTYIGEERRASCAEEQEIWDKEDERKEAEACGDPEMEADLEWEKEVLERVYAEWDMVWEGFQSWFENRTVLFPWALEHRPVMRKISQVENSILYKEHECKFWFEKVEQDCEDWDESMSWGELPDIPEHQFPKPRRNWKMDWVAEQEQKNWEKLMKLVGERERNGGMTNEEIEKEIERQCKEYDEMEQNRYMMEDPDDMKLLALMRPAA